MAPQKVPRANSEPTWLGDPSGTLPGPSWTPPGNGFETNLGPQDGPRETKIVDLESTGSSFRRLAIFFIWERDLC